ncbi:MAG TPA: DnaJ C-terminal domain-containing protein, partial [Verrucomicrobiae bacterium]|nr:DnaJ C-terminal domain-containing protein [Verrucomicrobiae bacterium]
KKQAYDMFGRAGVDGGAAGAGFAQGFGGLGDIFDAFFGGAAAGGRRTGRANTGSDLRYDLRITFAEAVLGSDKEIEFPVLDRCATCNGTGAKPGTSVTTCTQCEGRGEIRSVRQTMLGQMVNVQPCPRCHGEGRTVDTPCETCRGEGRLERRKKIRVTVPAGIDEGHQIRLSGEGEVGPHGGPAGSLYVAVHIQPHKTLKREGTELFLEREISIAQAALGTRLTIPTMEGDEQVEIKAGTQPGAEIRLRGKGVPHLRRANARGDLHVFIKVAVPTRLNKKQRELLEALAAASGESVTSGSGILDRVKDALG